MTINSIAGVADAYEQGRYWDGYMLKTRTTLDSNLQAQDLSYAPGIPAANYYASAPGISAVLDSIDGIASGPPVSSAGYTKYLHKIAYYPPAAVNSGQTVMYFHDLVMYYPFVEGDGGDQTMTNNIPIPRYGGEGCRIMLTVQGQGALDSGNVYVTYTNTLGNQRTVRIFVRGTTLAGRVPGAVDTVNLAARQPYLLPANQPYIPLAQNCTGVRSIDSINFQDAIGGIFAFSIVKPLGVVSTQDQSTATTGPRGCPVEIDFMRDRLMMPSVGDGANIYSVIKTTIAGTNTIQMAQLSFIWG